MTKCAKRIFSAIVCLMMCAFMVTGCEKSQPMEKDTQSGQTKTTEAAKNEPPHKIRMVNRVNVEYVVQDNPVLKEIEKKANVQLDIEIPPMADYEKRVGIIMASGDLPDIICMLGFNATYSNFAENGLLIPLDDIIAKCPNIKAKATKEQLEGARVAKTGKLHGIVRPHIGNYLGMNVRADWLEKLNLKAPTTAEEFLEVAKAFADKDPDGNGKADTFGFTISTDWKMLDQSITRSFGVNPNFIPDTNGKVTISEAQPAYMEILDFYRKCYEQKALDPEFYLNKGSSTSEKWKKGKVGFSAEFVRPNDLFNTGNDELRKAFPEAKIEFVLPLKDKSGKRIIYDKAPIWAGFSITKDCKKPERVMQFVDYMFSDEGMTLSNLGVKGVNYDSFDIKTGRITRTQQQIENANKYVASYMSFITAVNGIPFYNPGNTPEKQEIIEKAFDNWKKNCEMKFRPEDSVLPEISDTQKANPDLSTQNDEIKVKYIMGQITKEQLKKFYDEKLIPANKPVIEAMQKYYDTKLKGK